MTFPNFLIVGAAKAGTTSLYHYLKQHPAIYMPLEVKETFFFSGLTKAQFPGVGNEYGNSAVSELTAYENLFASVTHEVAIGEACVAYLYYYETAIDRILQILGSNTKIIICLRDPLDRAYSNYLHHVRDNLEPLSFLQAIQAQNSRREAGWWWGFDYLPVSFYFPQVKAYLDTFGRTQTLILRYDDLVQDPRAVLKTIFTFLEVDPTFAPDISIKHNVSVIPRSKKLHHWLTQPNRLRSIFQKLLPSQIYWKVLTKATTLNLKYSPKLSTRERRKLQPQIREDILKLQDLIQQDLSTWLQT